MAAQQPHLTGLGSGLGRRLDDSSGSQRPRVPSATGRAGGQLLGAEAGQGRVDLHADQGGKLALQQRRVPACGLVASVVHEAVGAGLGRRQTGDDDDRHLGQAQLQGGQAAGVTGRG